MIEGEISVISAQYKKVEEGWKKHMVQQFERYQIRSFEVGQFWKLREWTATGGHTGKWTIIKIVYIESLGEIIGQTTFSFLRICHGVDEEDAKDQDN